MRQFLKQLSPFIFICLIFLAFAFSLVLLAYLLFYGAIIGITVYLINWLKGRFFPEKVAVRPVAKSRGRIIDADDWKHL